MTSNDDKRAPMREALEKVQAALKLAADAINAVPGRLRDRPDYITSLPCDVACRLLEAEQVLRSALAAPEGTSAVLEETGLLRLLRARHETALERDNLAGANAYEDAYLLAQSFAQPQPAQGEADS
ncbi:MULTISPECIES: hypothetical protein [Bacteria]|uniref:Uncharacterized protein n=1 Tax=Deinococcus navajonensis TaxID=309884 RepID=A0ABV8XL29_9DEIO